MAEVTSTLFAAENQDGLTTGVYGIVNLVNGKIYVGSAGHSLKQREKQHWWDLRGQRHHNRHLQAAWNKYGSSCFVFVALQYLPPGEAIWGEQWWMAWLRAVDKRFGYNLSLTADYPRGHRASAATRDRLSKIARQRIITPERREAYSAAQKRRWSNPKAKLQRIKKWRKRYANPEEKAKLTEMLRKRWADPEAGHRQAEALRERNNRPEEKARFAEFGRQRGLLWADPVRKAEMLRKRRETLTRKRAEKEASKESTS